MFNVNDTCKARQRNRNKMKGTARPLKRAVSQLRRARLIIFSCFSTPKYPLSLPLSFSVPLFCFILLLLSLSVLLSCSLAITFSISLSFPLSLPLSFSFLLFCFLFLFLSLSFSRTISLSLSLVSPLGTCVRTSERQLRKDRDANRQRQRAFLRSLPFPGKKLSMRMRRRYSPSF